VVDGCAGEEDDGTKGGERTGKGGKGRERGRERKGDYSLGYRTSIRSYEGGRERGEIWLSAAG